MVVLEFVFSETLGKPSSPHWARCWDLRLQSPDPGTIRTGPWSHLWSEHRSSVSPWVCKADVGNLPRVLGQASSCCLTLGIYPTAKFNEADTPTVAAFLQKVKHTCANFHIAGMGSGRTADFRIDPLVVELLSPDNKGLGPKRQLSFSSDAAWPAVFI
eukprot:g40985.t1